MYTGVPYLAGKSSKYAQGVDILGGRTLSRRYAYAHRMHIACTLNVPRMYTACILAYLISQGMSAADAYALVASQVVLALALTLAVALPLPHPCACAPPLHMHAHAYACL